MKKKFEIIEDDNLEMPRGACGCEGNLKWEISNFLTQVIHRVHFKTYVWI